MKQPPHIPGPDPGSLPAEMGHRHPHLAEKENFIQINRQTVPLNKPNQKPLPKLRLNGGILVRASATCRILFGMTIIFSLFAGIVMRRIWMLEVKNELIQSQLNDYRDTLKEVLLRLPLLVPELTNQVPLDSIEISPSGEEAREIDNESDETFRVRRDLAINVTLSPGNGSYEAEMPGSDEALNPRSRVGRKSKEHHSRDKGKGWAERVNAPQKAKDDIRKLKLRLKLANTRRRAAVAHFTKAKATLSSSARNFSDARAIYMIPVTPNVNIKKAEQLIGPWYIGEGSDFGFNDLWYRDISLDANKTSIIFQKSGLHLIYAQVYYHLTLGIGERPAPMGYRIYIKKKNPDGRSAFPFRRPIPIAECVPSFPTTFYQTCFTQAAWYMEAGDQVYLEHFANSFPMIEADRQGKTFLGIVRLSSAQ